MTQTPVTPAAAADALQGIATDRLMLDLLRRANEALGAQRNRDAERLLRAALAWWPGDAAILLVLGEIALADGAWDAAAGHTLEALRSPLSPNVFVRACAIQCGALWMKGGTHAVAPVFSILRDKLDHALQASGDLLTHADLNLGATAAMCAGDVALAHKYFLRRFATVLSSSVETRVSPSITLRAWCAANHALFQVLDPVKHIDSTGLPPIHGAWAFDTDGVNLAVIPRGEMHSGLDFAFTPTGEMLIDSGHMKAHTGTGWYPRIHADPTNLVLHLWASAVREIDEAALFMSCSQGWHVGHWIVDFLPRLRALKHRPDLKVAIPTETPQKHRDFLALFGIDQSRIIDCDLNHRYRFRELVVVQTGSEVNPEPNNVCFVADALRVRPRPAVTPLRLFLERDMKNRAIVNQAEFYDELDRLGFTRVNLAAMSVAEQRAALSAAEAVIATYGSDPLAFYMMNERAALIELNWSPETLDAHFDAKTSMVGVKYYLLPCVPVENPANRLYKKDSDFLVDLPMLRQILRAGGIAIPADA